MVDNVIVMASVSYCVSGAMGDKRVKDKNFKRNVIAVHFFYASTFYF